MCQDDYMLMNMNVNTPPQPPHPPTPRYIMCDATEHER